MACSLHIWFTSHIETQLSHLCHCLCSRRSGSHALRSYWINTIGISLCVWAYDEWLASDLCHYLPAWHLKQTIPFAISPFGFVFTHQPRQSSVAHTRSNNINNTKLLCVLQRPTESNSAAQPQTKHMSLFTFSKNIYHALHIFGPGDESVFSSPDTNSQGISQATWKGKVGTALPGFKPKQDGERNLSDSITLLWEHLLLIYCSWG